MEGPAHRPPVVGDPESGGVIITMLESVPEITIAASSGPIGGTASLHVTAATPEQWALGEARYNNGVEFEIPMLDFGMLIDEDGGTEASACDASDTDAGS